MNTLSLCAGVGGFDLGLKCAIQEVRTICYVEIEPFCQEILLRRMDDGWLDRAPIWPDLRTFDGRPWRGVVDCVASGFPCQPFSTAGKRPGAADARNLWPDVRRIISESEPAVVVLENVSGSLPYFYHVVLPELQSLGYAVEAGLFTAAEVGAPHRRQRLFVLAHSAERARERGFSQSIERNLSNSDGKSLGDPESERLERSTWKRADSTGWSCGEPAEGCQEFPPWPPGPTERDRWAAVLARWPDFAPAVADPQQSDLHQATTSETDGTGRIATASGSPRDDGQSKVAPEPPLRRVAHGIPHRVDRLRALGNGVVPVQVVLALQILQTTRQQ